MKIECEIIKRSQLGFNKLCHEIIEVQPMRVQTGSLQSYCLDQGKLTFEFKINSTFIIAKDLKRRSQKIMKHPVS